MRCQQSAEQTVEHLYRWPASETNGLTSGACVGPRPSKASRHYITYQPPSLAAVQLSKPCKGAVQVSHLKTPLETTFLKTKPLVLGPVPT